MDTEGYNSVLDCTVGPPVVQVCCTIKKVKEKVAAVQPVADVCPAHRGSDKKSRFASDTILQVTVTKKRSHLETEAWEKNKSSHLCPNSVTCLATQLCYLLSFPALDILRLSFP